MKRVLKFPVEKVTPSAETILKAQGISGNSTVDDRILRLAKKAISAYEKLAKPIGITMDISKRDFENVFTGEGNNENDAPLGSIYESSQDLALFAVTIGNRICGEISDLFAANDFATGSMLDYAASEGADMTAEALEVSYRDILTGKEGYNRSIGIMRFSPGYCGWHISAQKKLFEFIQPGEIGIELNDSFLMTPIKSVSGVIVTGKKDIFVFDDIFDFCTECNDRSCQDMIRTMMESDSF
jgi:hypothetical protein